MCISRQKENPPSPPFVKGGWGESLRGGMNVRFASRPCQRGISQIVLIMFIVDISVMLAGILTVMLDVALADEKIQAQKC